MPLPKVDTSAPITPEELETAYILSQKLLHNGDPKKDQLREFMAEIFLNAYRYQAKTGPYVESRR